MRERSFSMSAGVPMPLRTILAPAFAKVRAYASPMPLVDPVTTAFLPVNTPILFPFVCRRRLNRILAEIIAHHGFTGLRLLEPFFVMHRELNIAFARAPVLDHPEV